MKCCSIFFSPTGGTKKAADILAGALGETNKNIDLSEANFSGCVLEEADIAVIAVPSFGGRAPKLAIDRLKKVRANGTKAVVVVVYGNRAQEDTLIELADTAKECGFDVIAGIEAVAEHSIARQYAAGRPDTEDARQLKTFAKQILVKIENPSAKAVAIPGNRPYKKAGAGLVPKGTSACTECGLCAAKCPSGAIDKSNPRRTDKNACINCMRCVAICPQNVRTVSSVMVKIVGMALKKECSGRKENVLFL